MTTSTESTPSTANDKAGLVSAIQSKFPSALTILFGLIIVMAALTWIVPSGEFDRVASESVGKDLPVPGTYHAVDANPQGIFDVLMAPIKGFYDPDSGTANAIDVVMFVLVLGGFWVLSIQQVL